LPDERPRPDHLTSDDLDAYYRGAIRATRRLASEPDCVLIIDPELDRILLRVPVGESAPDVSMFDRIELDVVQDYGSDDEWFELAIDATGNRYEAYHVIASIVDLMIGGVGFGPAVAETLASFKDILSRRQRLTDEQQVGLLGELLFLEHCLDRIGPQEALDAWLGAAGEEHDFVFASFDVELKSTRSEARVHVINSTTQLESSPNRPLYLLSQQFTAAGAAKRGATLPNVINRIRKTLGPQKRRVLDTEVEKIGWRDEDEALYPNRWVSRSEPRAYIVDEDFPAITPTRLASAVPKPEHVVSVQYRLDVTQLEAAPAPYPVDQFCQEG
jgi:hypothetical protein